MAIQGTRLVVPRAHEVVAEAFDVPAPGPGQLLLETEASLVSAGTELAIFTGIHQGLTNPATSWPKYPQGMGYMSVGRVVALGEGVTGYQVGDRFFAGGHSSHTLVEASGRGLLGWKIPAGIPARRAVFARMAKTAVTAPARSGVTLGQSVAVVGLGIIGQIALRLYNAAGAYPIAGVDGVAARRAAAKRGGAVATFAPGDDTAAEVRRFLSGGADIVVDTTGWATALPGAMALAAEGGQVVVLGSPRGTADGVDFYSDLHRRSLHVIGAHDSGVGPEVRERFPWTNERILPYVIHLVESGKLPVDDLVTHFVPPTRLPEMYAGLLDRKEEFLGVVLDWAGAGAANGSGG
jgi:2-desacetyl-2-hydroxyethyl bacteriochlorophyllide A dehydrogenase